MTRPLFAVDFLLAPKSMVRRYVRAWLTVVALVAALLHVTGSASWPGLASFDRLVSDTRAKWVASQSLGPDPRIVIVDIDERSLAELGQWPWPRSEIARMTSILLDAGASVVGFDVVFPEAEQRAGLEVLRQLTRQSSTPALTQAMRELQRGVLRAVEGDEALERAFTTRPVVLGYYFTSERDGFQFGHLPAPVLNAAQLSQGIPATTEWTGYGANLLGLNDAAAGAGFFNAITDVDGVVRRLPLIASFEGNVYESFALSVYRQWGGWSDVSLVYADNPSANNQTGALSRRLLRAIRLSNAGGDSLDVPLDGQAAQVLDFASTGGAKASAFQYISASDVLANRMQPGLLSDAIVLIGASAPGLQDLRVTAVNPQYPGVEAHATALASLLDQRVVITPPWSVAINVTLLLLLAVPLLVWLPRLRPVPSIAVISILVVACLAVHEWLYVQWQWLVPVAGPIGFLGLALSLQILLSYVLERRTRSLAELFGSYLPDTLVDEMRANAAQYSLQADAREMTVMFADMRNFTAIAEPMTPSGIQQLLNRVLSDLTEAVGSYRGTLDKYLGDGLMAFWGAPLYEPRHAYKAVACAMDMAELAQRNASAWHGTEHNSGQHRPPIRIGIGIGTGTMFVGDMGSSKRRSYTVLGDTVNLTARVEALCKRYGVDIIATQTTVDQTPEYAWRALDVVQVRGRSQEVAIYQPVALHEALTLPQRQELVVWDEFFSAWRSGDAELAKQCLVQLTRTSGSTDSAATSELYALYQQRLRERFGDPSQASVSKSMDPFS